jgi:hypothetical protein
VSPRFLHVHACALEIQRRLVGEGQLTIQLADVLGRMSPAEAQAAAVFIQRGWRLHIGGRRRPAATAAGRGAAVTAAAQPFGFVGRMVARCGCAQVVAYRHAARA